MPLATCTVYCCNSCLGSAVWLATRHTLSRTLLLPFYGLKNGLLSATVLARRCGSVDVVETVCSFVSTE